jgi:hypothetical protein
MSYLLYLCLFKHSGVQHMCLWVFFLCCVPYVASFSKLSSFLFIIPLVFSDIYLLTDYTTEHSTMTSNFFLFITIFHFTIV